MSESSGQPVTPPVISRFRDRPHAKLLLAIVAVELLAIVALLVWVIMANPAIAPAPKKTTQQTAAPTTAPQITLVKVASGLTAPVAITAMPDTNDRRLFVAEQGGTIRIIDKDRKLQTTPFLDISSKVTAGGEMGLLGLAFHPKVAQNNFFFVNYVDKDQNTIVARYTFSKQSGLADPKSEKVILKIKQPFANHNGGDIKFGPDGYLYIGMGDGGSAGDPDNRAQNKQDLLGKLLRIDVDKGNPYRVPGDNPFAKSGGKPEIWALGLRNPWRFSFDRATGDVYIADVGQGDYEEIDFIAAGAKPGQNFGWRCYEASHTFNATDCGEASAYVSPVLEYDHTQNRCSVTGGFVYRGTDFPNMVGRYFYGDFCSGDIYYTQATSGAWQSVAAFKAEISLSTFGEDGSGELYLTDLEKGDIYRIEDANQ